MHYGDLFDFHCRDFVCPGDLAGLPPSVSYHLQVEQLWLLLVCNKHLNIHKMDPLTVTLQPIAGPHEELSWRIDVTMEFSAVVAHNPFLKNGAPFNVKC